MSRRQLFAIYFTAMMLTVIGVVGFGAWMFRVEATPAASVGAAVITDRWSGKVYSCILGTCYLLYPKGFE